MVGKNYSSRYRHIFITSIFVVLAACASPGANIYHDPIMDFAAVQSVAVLPFANLTSDELAGERVRDVFATALLSTEALYVLPPGEVARGLSRANIAIPTTPSTEEISRLAGIINVEAVITGVVREYGVVRSGPTSANIISLSVKMVEAETGKVVWTASSTKGGIITADRLFGGGGKPMNDITVEAVNDIIDKLFQ